MDGKAVPAHHADRADGAIVFCREDPGMAASVKTLYQHGVISWILLSGGIGKDSGEQSKKLGAEAIHQFNMLRNSLGEIPDDLSVQVETKSKNGFENSLFSIECIAGLGWKHDRVILVVHPRNARRVYQTHLKIAKEKDFAATYQVIYIDQKFDSTNKTQCLEVCKELIRIADDPGKGLAEPDPTLPMLLVKDAREIACELESEQKQKQYK